MTVDYSAWVEMVNRIAAEYKRKYSYFVEVDDLRQEMYLWFVTHPRKFKDWTALEEKEQDKLIARSLRNACLKYCEKEKARQVGYDTGDLYYYDISVVEAFLPTIVTESYEMPAKIKDLANNVKSTEVSDGMNWLALRADIAKAFYQLSDVKQFVLSVRFTDESADWATVAKTLGGTPDSARMKVQRAMNSLIQNLGGWRPYYDPDKEEDNKPETREVE